MRNSKITVSLKELNKPNAEPVVFTAVDAAQFLDLDVEYFIRKTNDGVFKYNGIEVERITPIKKKSGTKIHRDDGKEWNSIKECVSEIGARMDAVCNQIRLNQCFDFNGHHYTAPEYKVIKHVHLKPKRKKLKELELLKEQKQLQDLDVPNTDAPTKQEILDTLNYEVKEVVKQLSTEDKCIQLLQQLAVERIQDTKYDKASKVIEALQLLKEV